MQEPFIHPGDGFIQVKSERADVALMRVADCTATFRMVIFKPFIGEILAGKIKGCSPDGVTGMRCLSAKVSLSPSVSLGFFHDILIPPHFLQEGTTLYVIFLIIIYS